MADDTTGQFTGNAFDLALEYVHNFAAVSWLDLYAKVDLKSTINSNHENLRNLYPVSGEDSTVHPKFIVNGVNSTSFGLGYLEGGVRLGGWGIVAVRQDLLLRGEVSVPFQFVFGGRSNSPFHAGSGGLSLFLPGSSVPLDIKLTLYGGIHAYPYRIGKYWNVPPGTTEDGVYNEGQEGLASSPSITDLYGGVSLAMGFGWTKVPVLDDCGLVLDASWRTDGSGTATTASASLWKLDSMDSLKYNGRLRLQATVSYAPTTRFSTFARFRYDYNNVIPLPAGTGTRRDAPRHEYYVQAGLSYRFGGQK